MQSTLAPCLTLPGQASGGGPLALCTISTCTPVNPLSCLRDFTSLLWQLNAPLRCRHVEVGGVELPMIRGLGIYSVSPRTGRLVRVRDSPEHLLKVGC